MQLKIMRVEGCSGGGAAVLERPVRRVHLHLSDASQPDLLPVHPRARATKPALRRLNARDGNLICKIIETTHTEQPLWRKAVH